MKNIVIAIDATEHSLNPLALGKRLGDTIRAPLVVVHTFDDGSSGSREEAERACRELMRTAAVEGDLQLLPGGKSAKELHRLSEDDSTGLLVIGSTTKGRLGRLFAGGGIGDRLLGGAGSPVAVAPHGYAQTPSGGLDRIGVAYDGSEDANYALDAAQKLARVSGAKVRLITVLERVAFGGTTTAGAFGQSSVTQVMRAELKGAHDEALANVPEGVQMEGRFLEGSPGDVLAQESRELDLITAGSRGFGPAGAVLMGGTTAFLMRNAECPGLLTPRGTEFDLLD